MFHIKSRILLFLIISLPFFLRCHDSLTVIKGCCEDPPLSGIAGNGRIWVPNVFTPNNDGLNDWMMIYCDSIIEIVHLEIRNEDNFVVYDNEHILCIDYAPTWNGRSRDKLVRGLFSYVIEVRAHDGTAQKFTGHICNCPCIGASDEDFEPISGCKFSLCPPQWIDCDDREYLPCFKY